MPNKSHLSAIALASIIGSGFHRARQQMPSFRRGNKYMTGHIVETENPVPKKKRTTVGNLTTAVSAQIKFNWEYNEQSKTRTHLKCVNPKKIRHAARKALGI